MTPASRPLVFPAIPEAPKKPWTRKNSDYVGLTHEALAAFRAEWARYEQAMREWRAACDDVAGEAARLLIAEGFPTEVKVWGRRSRVSRALNVALRDFGPILDVTPTLWLSDEEQWLRLSGVREREAQYEQTRKELRDRAVAWLLARGKVYGVDFVAEAAPDLALKIVAEEKIRELRQGSPWLEFNGHNCNDVAIDDERRCNGWNGESRRCQCGNRRVSWEIEGTFEHPRVYGEAY